MLGDRVWSLSLFRLERFCKYFRFFMVILGKLYFRNIDYKLGGFRVIFKIKGKLE